MPREAEFEGKIWEFPDDFTDEEVLASVAKFSAPPPMGEVVRAVPGMIKRGAAGLTAGAAKLTGDVLGIKPLQESAQEALKGISLEAAEETPRNMTTFQQGIATGLHSAATVLPVAAATAVAGPAIGTAAGAMRVMTSVMGAQTGLQRYGELREDNKFPPTRAGLHAAFEAIVEGVTEYWPAKEIGKNFLVKQFSRFFTRDYIGELVATTLQDISAKLSDRPDMTLGDYVRDLAVTSIAVPIGGAVQYGAMRGASALMPGGVGTEQAAPPPATTLPPLTPPPPDVLREAGGVLPPAEAPPTPPTTSLPAPTAGPPPTPPNEESGVTSTVAEALSTELLKKVGALGESRVSPALPATSVEAVTQAIRLAVPPVVVARAESVVPPAGSDERVYAAIAESGMPEQFVVATRSRAAVEEVVRNTPGTRMVYFDAIPAAFEAMTRRADEVHRLATENLDPGGGYVVDTKMLTPRNIDVVVTPESTPEPITDNNKPSRLSTPHAVKGAVTVSFPNKLLQTFYLLGHMVHEINTGKSKHTAADVEHIKNLLVKESGESATSVLEQADLYEQATRLLVNDVPIGDIVYAPTMKRARLDYVQRTYVAPHGLKPGEVALADGVMPTETVKLAQAYLQRWTKLFLPEARIVIAGEALTGNAASVGRWNGVHYIFIPKFTVNTGLAWRARFAFVLAHEFGHVVFNEHVDNPQYTALVARLRGEHAELMSRVDTMNTEQFINMWFGPHMRMLLERGMAWGVKPTDPARTFINTLDTVVKNGFGLSFSEWMAEQFARHVNNERGLLAFSKETTSFWESLKKQLAHFFDRVVKQMAPTETYKEFVNTLSVQSGIEATLASTPVRSESSVEGQRTAQEFEYTTRVLDRLPNKPRVKKLTIQTELARKDVRGQESRLLLDVMSEMPGDSVDMQLFRQEVLNRVIPLSTSLTGTYASLGVSALGYLAPWTPSRNYARETGQTTYKEHGAMLSAYTRLYSAPFETGGSNHFPGEAPNYWAHVRGFNLRQNEKNIRVVVEIQSDIEQKRRVAPEDRGGIELRVKELESFDHLLVKVDGHVAAEHPLDVILQEIDQWHNPPETRPLNAPMFDGSGFADRLEQRLEVLHTQSRGARQIIVDEIRQDTRLRLAELKNKLGEGIQKTTLPKFWGEHILLSEMQKAAREGADVLRIPGGDETVAAVEGYKPVYTMSVDTAKNLFLFNREVKPGTQVQLATEYSQSRVSYSYEIGGVTYNTSGLIFPYRTSAPAMSDDVQLKKQVSFHKGEIPGVTASYGEGVQPTLERYRKLARFAREKLGGKDVMDGRRQGIVGPFPEGTLNEKYTFPYVEIPLKTELANMPVVYYSIDGSLTEQIDEAEPELAKVDKDLPTAVRALGASFTKILQLNQQAKLWPNLWGLRTYRQAMRNLHALKSELFEGPNRQLEQWHRLSTKHGEGVEVALRAEVNSGGHWTELLQNPDTGQWFHVLGPSAKQVLTSRGLSPKAQDLFVSAKNDFLVTLQAMEKVLQDNMREFFKDSPLVLAQREAELDTLFRELREKPYLPDTRFGQWSVQIRAGYPEKIGDIEVKKGDLVYWEKFDTKSERNAALARLERIYGRQHKVSGGYDPDFVQPFSGLPGEFITNLIEELNQSEATKLSAAQTLALQELAFYQTRAGRFAHYLKMPKKGTGGASTDVRRAYAAYHWKAANAIAKMRYGRELRRSIGRVQSAAQTIRRQGGGQTSDAIDRVHEYLNDNYKHVMQPENDLPQLRAFGALWYLFGSVKTALMNFSSVPVLTYPYIAARHGDVASLASLAKSMRDVAQYWRNPEKLSPDLQRVLQKAREDNVTDQSFAAVLASVADGGVAFEKLIPRFSFLGNRYVSDMTRRTTWRILAMGMSPFRVIEQLNRQVTLLAMYGLESSKLGKTLSDGDTTAYDRARDAVDHTQNEYTAWNQPQFMWGKKAVVFLFFSFVQNMSFMLFGGDKSWWRAMMVLAAMGGLLALPGVENLIDMLNFAWRKWSGQHVDLREEAREVFNAIGMNPDFAMHGLSHNMFGLGWDVSSSIGQGRVIPGTDAIFGIGKFEQRFVQAAGEIGGPMGGIVMAFLQALADDNPSVLTRFNRALPAMFRGVAKAYGAVETGEFQDPSGRGIIKDPTAMEIAGQAAGFAPTRLREKQEVMRLQRDAAVFYMERRTNLMEMYYNARKMGNTDAVDDIKDAISKYNSGVPAPMLAIRPDDLSRSVKNRARVETLIEAGHSPQKRYEMLFRQLEETYL